MFAMDAELEDVDAIEFHPANDCKKLPVPR